MRDGRLKIAVQSSGRLTDHSLGLLARCGLDYSRNPQQLVCFGENMPIDVMLVRDDDIPELVRDGTCDLGIVGLNVAEERRLEHQAAGLNAGIEVMMPVGFGECRLAIAAPEPAGYAGPDSLQGKRIATTYPHILAAFLKAQQVEDAQIVNFRGSVEIAPRLGKADFICDLVSTGGTLAANHLQEVEIVLKSQAALIRNDVALDSEKACWRDRLVQRMEGVIQVRESKYIMLHAPRSALAAITALLPGTEGPTVMQLEGCQSKVAVHAVCPENVFWETLEALKAAGASSLLVLPVEKMLA